MLTATPGGSAVITSASRGILDAASSLGRLVNNELAIRRDRIMSDDKLTMEAALDFQLDPGESVRHRRQIRVERVLAVAATLARAKSAVPDNSGLGFKDHRLAPRDWVRQVPLTAGPRRC
jgi:hypothetical protein